MRKAKAPNGANRLIQLAADRTSFAAERTYAAWVRTGLVALVSGISAKKLLGSIMPEWMIIGTGTVLVFFSAFCFGAAVWREIYSEPLSLHPDASRIPGPLLATLSGFLALVAITVLFWIWLGPTGGD